MSEFKLEARAGFNDTDKFNVQVVVTQIDSMEEARALSKALCDQFQSFLEARGGRVTKATSPRGSEFKGVILPPDYGKPS